MKKLLNLKTKTKLVLLAAAFSVGFVAFALFAYNQEQYVREAIEGAFSQTYQPLEIILSDEEALEQDR